MIQRGGPDGSTLRERVSRHAELIAAPHDGLDLVPPNGPERPSSDRSGDLWATCRSASAQTQADLRNTRMPPRPSAIGPARSSGTRDVRGGPLGGQDTIGLTDARAGRGLILATGVERLAGSRRPGRRADNAAIVLRGEASERCRNLVTSRWGYTASNCGALRRHSQHHRSPPPRIIATHHTSIVRAAVARCRLCWRAL